MQNTPSLKRSAALGFIFVTIFIDVLGLAVIIPVLPKLLEALGHLNNSEASEYNGWLTTTYASMQLIFSPVIGNLSDRFGRRPVLLASLIGFSIDYTFMAFAPTIGWLFLGRFIAGVTGATNATAMAYIADISEGEKRSTHFGLVGAASGLGFIIGISGGAFLGEIGIKLPFIAAAALALLNALYGYFVLPESLQHEHRRKLDWQRINPSGILKTLSKYRSFAKLLNAFALVYIGQKAVEYILPFFVYEKFNWAMHSVGLLGLFIGLLLVGIQGWLIRLLIPKFGLEKNIVGGLLSYALGLILIAFASYGWQLYIYMIPYCLGGVSGPALQGLISNRVSKSEQGELQGILNSISSLSIVIGPLLMSYVFRYFTNRDSLVYFPGAAYILGAMLMLASVSLAISSFKKRSVEAADTP
ncbi:MAG TPA: TCR/Tet family MFS transporter [Mucilaginibacter sp.]|nr:TCR/Tet family MFS transporter [Mucilaginibacter sp.]